MNPGAMVNDQQRNTRNQGKRAKSLTKKIQTSKGIGKQKKAYGNTVDKTRLVSGKSLLSFLMDRSPVSLLPELTPSLTKLGVSTERKAR